MNVVGKAPQGAPSADLRPALPGQCRISVRDGEQTFDVPKNNLLLLSALDQGIDYPHNCRVGTCGRCKTKLLAGRISPMIDFALSPLTNEELAQGYVLACQSKVRTDLVIDVKIGHHAMEPVRSIPAEVVRCQRLPGEVIDLRLRL